MKLNDAVFGLLLLVLGGSVLFVVQSFPKIPGQQVGPALFPGLIATGLCLGGAILLLRGWRSRHSAPWLTMRDWVQSPRHLVAFGLLVSSVVFYIAASQALGFLPCSVIVLSALFYVLKVPLGRALLTAIVVSLLIHFVFYKLLRVPLPWGILVNHTW